MAIKLSEIPIIEDIYDFDTITLGEVTEKVQITLNKLENIESKDQSQVLWIKKAKRYLELALQEVEERKAVENFGNFCASNNDSILMSNADDTSGVSDSQQNKQFSNQQQKNNNIANGQNTFGNVDEWIKLHQQLSLQSNSQQLIKEKKSLNPIHHPQKQYSVPHQIKESEQEDDENYQSINQNSQQKNYINSSGKKQKYYKEQSSQDENEEEDDNLHSASVMKKNQLSGKKGQQNTDFCNNSIISGKSLSSSASSQAKYLAHQKRMKNKSKQDQMQEFIRQTLEKTRITTNTNVGGQPGFSSYNFHKNSNVNDISNDETEINISRKKKKSSTSGQVTSAQLPKSQNIMQVESFSNEYAGVQSRIKQELEQQRLKKLETPYFTTGKASYPKYKPPEVKKLDPQEEKKNRTKNFLKRSQPSVVLPPINQKVSGLSNSVDVKILNGHEKVKKKNSSMSSRTAGTGSVTTSASTDNLSEKLSVNNTDQSHHIADDQNLHIQSDKFVKRNDRIEKLGSYDAVTGNQEGEIIQEEINENYNESDGEKQKNIPGQPRKITKGELLRIQNSSAKRSQTSDRRNTSQFGESQTPNVYTFSENPQQFIDEEINNDQGNIIDSELRDKLQQTKNRQSLQSVKNNIVIEDHIKKNESEIKDTFNSMNKQELQEQQKSKEIIDNNITIKSNSNKHIPSIIPPEKEGLVSIKAILFKENEVNDQNVQSNNNDVLLRREADENPTDSDDDLDEEEKQLLYNQASLLNQQQSNDYQKQNYQTRKDFDCDQQNLDEEERELIQNDKKQNKQSSKEKLNIVSSEEKLSSKKSNILNKNTSNIETYQKQEDGDSENSQEVSNKGDDKLDEDEETLLVNNDIKKQDSLIFQKDDEDELIEKYDRDSKEIVQNAKKILENKGINEQLRNRMEKLLNNFSQNQIEVDKIEQKVKENEEMNKKHKEDVKKNKNQIFGRPSSDSKRKSESNINDISLTKKSMSKKENEETVVAAASENGNSKNKIVKKPSLQDAAIDIKNKKNKEDRAGVDITNNTSTEKSQSLGKSKTVGKKTKSKEEVEELEVLQSDQEQILKEQKQIMKKKQLPAAPPKPPSMASKLLTKMMKEIDDDSLIDYTSQIPSFFHLFSGYYNTVWTMNNPMMGGNVGSSVNMNLTGGGGNFCLIDQMRDMYSLFQQHVEKVDNADKGLLRYKQVVTPLDVLPSEVYYVNDPQKVIVYQNRVDIDMRKFIERQIIFTQRMNGENFAGHLLPHEEFYYRVVKSKPEVYDIISRSFMRKRDWFELPHGLQLRTSWNLLWTWSKPQIDFNKLLLFQKVNHYPFNKNLVRKDLLKKNFERITKLGQKAASVFNILPLTFVLPKEYCNFSEKFYEEMLKEGENNIWIMKPVGKSQGRGISLVNDIAQVVYAEPVVVQKYMKDPLLLDGYKFDMRIYALVTHMKPLEAFVYREGFARLSTEKYCLNAQTIKNNQIHLTNYSIQKHHYDQSSNNNFIGGTKISLKMLQEKLKSRGIDWERIWTQIQEIIVKSVLACQADIPNNPNCFEIFGYDIIIDSSLKCILLEINSSPSLARDFIIDDLIKQQMIDDAIDLVTPVQFDRLRLLEVLDRRIREEQGNKSNINTTNNSKLQLNRDLNYILRGQKLRQFGESPAYLGQWQKVAPTEMSDKYLKIIQSYKLPSVRQNTANAANNNNTID